MHFSNCVLAFMASTAVMAAPAIDYSAEVRKSIDAGSPGQVESLLARDAKHTRGFLNPLVDLATNRLNSIINQISETDKQLASGSASAKVRLLPTVQTEAYELESGIAVMEILNSAGGHAALSSSQISSIKQVVTATLTQSYSIDKKSLNSSDLFRLNSAITIFESIAKALGFAIPPKASSSTISSTSTTPFPTPQASTTKTSSTTSWIPFTTRMPISLSSSSMSTLTSSRSSTSKIPTSSVSTPSSLTTTTPTTTSSIQSTSTTSSPTVSVIQTSSITTSSFVTSVTSIPSSSASSSSISQVPTTTVTPNSSPAASTTSGPVVSSTTSSGPSTTTVASRTPTPSTTSATPTTSSDDSAATDA